MQTASLKHPLFGNPYQNVQIQPLTLNKNTQTLPFKPIKDNNKGLTWG